MKPADLVKFAQDNNAKMIDCKFIDFVGSWQHITYPIERLEDGLEEGFGFDGSSIRGWRAINNSDMLMQPDTSSAQIDPFLKTPTLSLICDVVDPVTQSPYDRCPRGLARRAEAYLGSTGIADTAYFGPEAEFFIFDSVRFDNAQNTAFYHVDSVEGRWNSGREEPGGNLGHKPNFKGGYFPVSPVDTFTDLRTDMVLAMQKVGIEVETHHHEVATAGQCEIDMKFDSMVSMADKLMWYKYIVKNVARQAGKSVTFMPKPLFGDNGSGMHTHQSLWKGGTPLFAGDEYAGMSEMALYYIGGILKHASAICALSNPCTNSYRRLVPGYEAPVNLAYSARNRSAAVRIPMLSSSPKSKRIEFRSPDPSCNPYLAFAAMMMAGLDGIENKIHPGDALDKDIYSLSPEELKEVPHVPHSLEAALDALQKDNAFLLKGDVFTSDLLDTWIEYKREREIDYVRLRPTPSEFALYYDI
ncbi:type I glutamate--ammonia ligase [Haliangium ochraceum]|uniref:Glutamine synthetase n=1 Tax=Haliangium ochraceum (strain DSM 14365 / JCM 11303 / SMP-2) TaxID=502025 RepID=D0LQ29_HALO1|nr:type I glutamate--ammonia ligase [Haliangium ochraceum]ACY17066.1 glutamine synthetase, type I [Haliangium ochraceum DSM 14365]